MWLMAIGIPPGAVAMWCTIAWIPVVVLIVRREGTTIVIGQGVTWRKKQFYKYMNSTKRYLNLYLHLNTGQSGNLNIKLHCFLQGSEHCKVEPLLHLYSDLVKKWQMNRLYWDIYILEILTLTKSRKKIDWHEIIFTFSLWNSITQLLFSGKKKTWRPTIVSSRSAFI